ncbi:MAG TPA: indole-3-glycerol phosphate synthase TrpC [Candidatus Udaeobacter sp.]|nr:indole-3-glycerol phosphate synthase TrpC [Candidatus Udaeobacter sp.]
MTKHIFSQILDRKRKAVAQLRADPASRDFGERALEIRKNAQPHRFLRALESDPQRLIIIAEFKRRSPSIGIIRDDLTVSEIVLCYERGGAAAISVLTDEEYFAGSIGDLCVARSVTKLPLLRKDFIIDRIQILEAATAGADAVLLIVAALDDVSLGQLLSLAEDELGLDALVEVHSSEELSRALDAGAKIIGVNNRDLKTFRVSLNTSERLIAEAPRDKIMISESGLHRADSLLHLHKLGFRGFLIGEALMRAPDPEAALRDLVAGGEYRQPAGLPTGAYQP